MTPKQVLQALKYARRKVEKGWIQFHIGQVLCGNTSFYYTICDLNNASSVCLLGGAVYGLERVCRDWDLTSDDLPEALVQALWDELSYPYRNNPNARTSDITNWNDEHGRTKEEVLALFDRAIVKLGAV